MVESFIVVPLVESLVAVTTFAGLLLLRPL